MNIGDVFYWVTDQAVGHDSRPKYHVYVCPSDWVDGHTFMFINKGMYGEDYKLLKSDYGFLEYDSYVSCSGLASYDDATLTTFDPTVKGTLSKAHLSELVALVDASRIMERLQKRRISSSLLKAST